MANGSAMQSISMSKFTIIRGQEKEKVLLVPYWNFRFIAWFSGEKNNNTVTKYFTHSHYSPGLTSISSPHLIPGNFSHATLILHQFQLLLVTLNIC